MTVKTISFNGTDYTEESLAAMSDPDLLSLRNLVAENLGVARIKNFKDHDQAVSATWKALNKWNAGDTKSDKPKEPKIVKGALPQKVKRPTRNMFRKIKKIGDPDRLRARWENYKDGMTILETIEGADMTPLDIYWYAENGYVQLIDPTEEEYQAGMAAWYAKNGLENPAEAKRKREEERAKAKAERAAKRAAEKEAKAKAKAA